MAALTTEEIAGIYTEGNPNLFNEVGFAPIRAKLTATAARPRLSHVINAAQYPTVYVTSDIHADLRKFTQILISSGLITTPFNAAFNPYTDDIYDPRFISESRWNAPAGTLLVIIGDLVDGKRDQPLPDAPWNRVNDPRGSFELLIFSLLYNLRIQANANASEVRYTLGNHEWLTVITAHLASTRKYVHEASQTFFGRNWIQTRQDTIMPFLQVCPYFIIVLQNTVGGVVSNEVAFIHGGLHTSTKIAGGNYQSFVAETIAFQTEIDNGLPNWTASIPASISSEPRPKGTLWTRTYSDNAAGECATLNSADNTIKLIVVGHCITASSPRTVQIANTNPLYADCDRSLSYDLVKVDGFSQQRQDRQLCVFLDCPNNSGADDRDAPRVAFVDVGMSACNHLPNGSHPAIGNIREIDNSQRIVQIMKLSHTDTPTHRFYNSIERVLIPSARVEDLYRAPALAAPAMGGKRKSRRYGKKSIKRNRRNTRKYNRR